MRTPCTNCGAWFLFDINKKTPHICPACIEQGELEAEAPCPLTLNLLEKNNGTGKNGRSD